MRLLGFDSLNQMLGRDCRTSSLQTPPRSAIAARPGLAFHLPDFLGQRRRGVQLERKVGVDRTAADQPNRSRPIDMIHGHPRFARMKYGDLLSSRAVGV